MYSFLISLCALVLGYIFYGRLVDRVFGSDPKRSTPAVSKADGVDFKVLPNWRVFMIQFLNIAGTGPIFGAIMGAKFGPSCYLWIVLGSIFAGGVHDYLSGMISLRSKGGFVHDSLGGLMSKGIHNTMLVFILVLLVLVGVVFVYSPSLILGEIAGFGGNEKGSIMIWVVVIFLYYVAATILPIDKVIGRIYPAFAATLLFMAFALAVCLFVKWPSIPEFWDGLQNRGPSAGVTGQSIFPCLCITVACGAISGFHSTQSPLMARCMKSESMGRPIFYGAMIVEGAVALIWAAVSSWFFFDGGKELLGVGSSQAPDVVTSVARAWLGTFGGALAIIGVVVAPISSGDTAFRSARILIADFLHFDQKPLSHRFAIAIPMFIIASVLLWYNIADSDGFNLIWRYFGLANQMLATMVLWCATEYLIKNRGGRSYLISLIPALLMTSVCITFLMTDKSCIGLPSATIPWIGAGSLLTALAVFLLKKKKAGN